MSYSKNDFWEQMCYHRGDTQIKWQRGSDGEPTAKTYANLAALAGTGATVPDEATLDTYWTDVFEPWLEKNANYELVKDMDIKSIMGKLCSCDASEGELQAAVYKMHGDIQIIKRKLGL